MAALVSVGEEHNSKECKSLLSGVGVADAVHLKLYELKRLESAVDVRDDTEGHAVEAIEAHAGEERSYGLLREGLELTDRDSTSGQSLSDLAIRCREGEIHACPPKIEYKLALGGIRH